MLKQSSSILIPVLIDPELQEDMDDVDEETLEVQTKRMVFLVHLQIGKMAVTVYTLKEFGEEDAVEAPVSEANSDELNDEAEEFSTPVVLASGEQQASANAMLRQPTRKPVATHESEGEEEEEAEQAADQAVALESS